MKHGEISTISPDKEGLKMTNKKNHTALNVDKIVDENVLKNILKILGERGRVSEEDI